MMTIKFNSLDDLNIFLSKSLLSRVNSKKCHRLIVGPIKNITNTADAETQFH